MPLDNTCSIDGCDRPYYGRSWCKKHYARWRSHGDPAVTLTPTRDMPLSARFWSKVDRDGPVPDHAPWLGPCWLWTAKLSHNGYGRFSDGAREVGAHRFALEEALGPIPAGLEVDHLCWNPPCVNPIHLESTTAAENALRSRSPMAINSRKIQCNYGHPLTPDNIYLTRIGGRSCRICRREQGRERKRRARAT